MSHRPASFAQNFEKPEPFHARPRPAGGQIHAGRVCHNVSKGAQWGIIVQGAKHWFSLLVGPQIPSKTFVDHLFTAKETRLSKGNPSGVVSVQGTSLAPVIARILPLRITFFLCLMKQLSTPPAALLFAFLPAANFADAVPNLEAAARKSREIAICRGASSASPALVWACAELLFRNGLIQTNLANGP